MGRFEEDVAWLAGIMDGEGSILPTKKENNYWKISIFNTDKSLIDKAKRIITEIIYDIPIIYEIKSRNANNKDGWILEINKREHQYIFIKTILPHLTCKKLNAISCLAENEKKLQLLLNYFGHNYILPEDISKFVYSFDKHFNLINSKRDNPLYWRINFGTKKEEIIKDISLLLNKYNLIFNVYKQNNRNTSYLEICSRDSLYLILKTIKPFIKTKINKVEKVIFLMEQTPISSLIKFSESGRA